MAFRIKGKARVKDLTAGPTAKKIYNKNKKIRKRLRKGKQKNT